MGKLKKTVAEDYKQLTVRIPPDLHRALRIRAAEEGKALTIIIEGLIRQYLVGGGS